MRDAHGKYVLLAVLSTQGFGLAIGAIIYGDFLGQEQAYLWAIPGSLLGSLSLILARRYR